MRLHAGGWRAVPGRGRGCAWLSLGYLVYICDGDTRRFADWLMAEGVAPEEASKLAEYAGGLLEERRRTAPNVSCLVAARCCEDGF